MVIVREKQIDIHQVLWYFRNFVSKSEFQKSKSETNTPSPLTLQLYLSNSISPTLSSH